MTDKQNTPFPEDGFALIVGLLKAILERLDAIDQTVDAVDRFQRPFGGGTREARRPRRGSQW